MSNTVLLLSLSLCLIDIVPQAEACTCLAPEEPAYCNTDFFLLAQILSMFLELSWNLNTDMPHCCVILQTVQWVIANNALPKVLWQLGVVQYIISKFAFYSISFIVHRCCRQFSTIVMDITVQCFYYYF